MSIKPRPSTIPAPQQVMHVTSAEVAEVLQQREQVLLLKRFMGAGKTVATVAKESGQPLHMVYRFARRMERLGLLQLDRIEQRAGRPMKVYACVSRRFFIPQRLCSLEEFFWHEFSPVLERLQRDLARTFEEGPNGAKGVLVGDLPADNWILAADANAVPWPAEEWGPTPQAPPAFSVAHEMHLDYDRAQAFTEELFQLVERFRAETGSGTYSFVLMMAPQRG